MANRSGKVQAVKDFIFLGSKNHCGRWLQSWNEKTPVPWKESYDKPRQCNKKQRHHFTNRGLYSQSYGFSSSHVWMWGMDHKEGQALKNWCFQNVILENTLESRVGCKDIKPVKTTGHQLWIFIGRTDTETEARTLWPLDVKSQLIRKIEGKRRGCQRMR